VKYLPLIWAGLGRRPLRTLLTMICVAIAFSLFGILDGVTAGFDNAVDRLTSATRLRTTNRISLGAGLPLSYRERIAAVPGVTAVGIMNFFNGYYRDPREGGLDSGALDFDHVRTFHDITVSDEQLEAMRNTRIGALIGPELVERFAWKVGDRVTLKSRVWTRKDGSKDWPFEIVGVYSIPKGAFPADGNFFMNYEYFDEARAFGNANVTIYPVKIDDPSRAADISAEIDRLFATSADQTLTQTESAFIHAQIDRVGNIDFIVGSIISAVLFALLFVTGITMMQSIAERIPELAVLKTYGFGDGALCALVLVESLLLCCSAALLGLAVAAYVFPTIYDRITGATLPLERIVLLSGAALAVTFALVSALPPLWRVRRLKIVDALAGR
jgi:putative ABC transport system permease protein